MIPARFCRLAFVAIVVFGFPVVFLLTGNVLPMIYVDDALAHGGAYALAAFLAVVGWSPGWGSVLCLGLVGVGGAIEILQTALPTGHEREWADMLANTCGIVGGWGAALICIAAAGSIAVAGRRGS